jgi:PAS domain S-box-containing protein
MSLIIPSRGDNDQLFRLVADSLPLLVWISGLDQRCTYFNKQWLAFTGRALESEIGDGWVEGVHAADLRRCLKTHTHAFEHRQPFIMEYRLRRHDGEYRWILDNAAPLFEADGSFAGYIGTCFDVTDFISERKDAEESLRRKEMELKEAQRLAGVGSWQWHRDMDMVVWSEELYRITGRDPGLPAVNYREHGQLYTRESWERLQRAVETALRSGTPYELVLEMLCADGRRKWVMGRGEAQRDSDGRITGLRGTVQDITERQLAEQALSSMNGRLIEAQESERARIARDLHDDIGQRLAVLAIALEQMKVPRESLDGLGALQEQTADIITEVQALSHELHPPRLLHLGVVAAMRGFCGELSGQRDVNIDFHHENVPATVPPDVSLCLFRVLQEALHNGVRHGRARHFDVQLRGVGDAVHLIVRDQGAGFDVEIASRGRGLGLTSMRERLKLVGGELVIESQSELGTTVLARLVPLRNAPLAARFAPFDGRR